MLHICIFIPGLSDMEQNLCLFDLVVTQGEKESKRLRELLTSLACNR